jgi:hypothetical protein
LKKSIIVALSFFVFTFALVEIRLQAQEDWSRSFPGGASIGQGVMLKREHLELHVPKSFEGRTANEWRTTQGVELQNTVRFARTESKVQLRGTSTVFDFDYTEDVLDVQIFRSRQRIPRSNSCMDCHGGNFSRTTAIVGQKHQELLPKPYKRGFLTIFLDRAYTESFHTEVNHWLNQSLMVKADYRWGYMKQSNYNLKAEAYTVGLAGRFKHRLTWSGDLIISKAETYPQRKTFVGKLNYRLFDGLKIGVSGGAFLDGYTQFGTEMAELGLMTTTMAKDDPDLLPSLFKKLKDDAFGYWHYSIEYEYRF